MLGVGGALHSLRGEGKGEMREGLSEGEPEGVSDQDGKSINKLMGKRGGEKFIACSCPQELQLHDLILASLEQPSSWSFVVHH